MGYSVTRWMGLRLIALLFVLASWHAEAASSQPIMQKFLAMGTASTSGVYYPVGKSLCELVNKGRLQELIRCLAYSTGGSEYNIQAVLSGELSLGITRTDLAYDAYHGKGDFAVRGPAPSLRQVFTLYDEPVVVIVKRTAGISRFEDIAGKRVNIGNRGSSQRGIVRMIMDAAKLRNEDFSSYRELTTTEMGDAFCKGEVDVISQALGMPAPFFKRMIEECDGVILPIPTAVIDSILATHPSLIRTSIPGGFYKGHDTIVPSFGMRTTLVASDRTSAESIRRFTKLIIDQLPELRDSQLALRDVSAKSMTSEGILIPLHDGVRQLAVESKTK